MESQNKNNNNYNEDDLNDKSENQINALKHKNKELVKQNKILTSGIESFNGRVKEINIMLEKKNKKFKKQITNYKNKLIEYRRKIILLKKKINELYKNNEYSNGNDNILSSLDINDFYKFPKSIIFNRNDILNKNHELESGYEYFGKRDNLFDNKRKYPHYRYNTYVYKYKNYLDNI